MISRRNSAQSADRRRSRRRRRRSARPSILHAQTKTLKITTWGGKWGDIMKATVLPAFEKEFKCTVSADQAFPYVPKLQASPKNDPLYDVLHTNSNEQWNCVTEGLVMDKITAKEVPNVADVYPYAVSDKIVGVSIFTSAIGLGFRTDKGLTKPTSWKDLADPKLAGVRGSYIIPVNSLGQCHLMMLGKIYGKGLQDLDAAYKALEQLKPIKLVDFTGQMEKMLLSGEVSIGVIHDSGRLSLRRPEPADRFRQPVRGRAGARAGAERDAGLQGQGAGLRLYRLHAAARRAEDAGRGRVVFAGQQEGEARRQVRRQAAHHRGQGGAR